MNIAIVGYGFVGKALHNGLKDHINIKIIDPKLNTEIIELSKFNPEIIFICVPTPMHNDGSQDISIVKNVFKNIKELNLDSYIVLKSTVLPDNIDEIAKITEKFIYNPEFLREKHADEDFINSDLIVFGGLKQHTLILSSFYNEYTKCICSDHIHTDVVTASLIKYTINSFLSTKVIFFNELKNLFDTINSEESWTNFIKFLERDIRIGNSHMMVPGHDGREGYGGACLPKDSRALLDFAKNKNIELNILKNTINLNNKIRSKYNTQTDREIDQNINFDGSES